MNYDNARLDRSLGVDEMVNRLKRAGWTGEDLKEQTRILKTEGLSELERFAGGELRKGTPLYPLLLEATAIRYTLHKTEREANLVSVAAPSECPHGFRMVACNSCLKGAA